MDLTGTYPKLTDADSVYAIREYSEKLAEALAGQIKNAAAKVSVPNATLTVTNQPKLVPYRVDAAMPGDFVNPGIAMEPQGGFRVAATGLYAVTIAAGAAGTINGAGFKALCRVNGVTIASSEVTMGPSAWLNTAVHFDALKLNANDLVEGFAQLTGTTGTLTTETSTTYATIAWVSAA